MARQLHTRHGHTEMGREHFKDALLLFRDFPDGPVVKNLPCNAGDSDVIPGWVEWEFKPGLLILNPHALLTYPHCALRPEHGVSDVCSSQDGGRGRSWMDITRY